MAKLLCALALCFCAAASSAAENQAPTGLKPRLPPRTPAASPQNGGAPRPPPGISAGREDAAPGGSPPQAQFPVQPGYPPQPGYPMQPGYPPQPGFGGEDMEPPQAQYPSQPGYPPPQNYPMQPGYPPQPSYPSQPGYPPPPPPGYPPNQGYQNGPGQPPQQASAVGQWQCQLANQSVSNNNFENWIYQFLLAVYPNGQFEAQGSYVAATAGFGVPFYAQGQWQAAPDGVLFRGQEQRQDGTIQQFGLVFSNFQPRSMSHQFSGGSGNLSAYCQR